MRIDSRIFVAGHRGLVGSAICRVLKAAGFVNLVLIGREAVDLRDPVAVKWLFSSYLPEYVFLCAARVGGIVANSEKPVEFMQDNMRIQLNVLESAKEYGVKKLLFLGSACAYPKMAKSPVREEDLLTGPLEPSNECYALAKISGIKLCDAYRSEFGCDFISAMPTNLYGVGDNYSPRYSHAIPGMIRKLHEAKRASLPEVMLWGTGKPTRDFIFSDDLARACLVLMEKYSKPGTINIGTGTDLPLCEIAEKIKQVVRYYGRIGWDPVVSDGTPKRRLDCSKILEMGWRPEVSLEEGLALTYEDFVKCQRL